MRSWWRPQGPDGLALLLLPLTGLWITLARIKRRRDEDVARRAPRPSVPTVVVGNWVVGGAGKTPTTLALLAHLKARGLRPGVVSRGHGRSGQAPLLVDVSAHQAPDVGDEPLLLARQGCAPVCVAADRSQGRDELLRRHPEINVVVADDGLQHRRLCRDLEIIVVDERGAGNGLCLPAGPLREPVPRELPDHSIVLYSGGNASLKLPGWVARRHLTGVQPWEAWAAGQPVPADGGWSPLLGRGVHALAAIAVPERFFEMLRQHGLEITPLALPDHDPIDRMVWPPEARDIVVTEKDAVKLARWAQGGTRIWVARLDLSVPDGFWAAVDARLGLHPPRSPIDPPTGP